MYRKPGIIIYIGVLVLAGLWIWLAWGLIAAKGLTLYNLLIIVMTGIIIFAPVYKKYFKSSSDKKEN